MARLILIAMFLISAAPPPHHADWQRCIMDRRGDPLMDSEHPMEGNAPISDLAKWAR